MSERLPVPDQTSRLTVADLDQALRTRLERLLEDHSQSDIARKTGWTRSNVNRYVHGAKIPGEFLSALSLGMNVHPVWLLSGKGEVYLTDLSSTTQTDAYDLLRLIQALSAVEKLRVGQVASKLHLKVLRDLREAMKKYRDVRESLENKLSPVFQRLMDDLRHALERSKLDRATNLRDSATHIVDFIDDAQLLLEFDQHQATLEYMMKRRTPAMEFQRKSFVRSLLAGREHSTETAVAAHNYVISLMAAGQLEEADNICQAARALIPPPARRLESFQRLVVLHAGVMIERGALPTASKDIQSVLADPVNQATQNFALDYSTKAMLLGATMQYENIAPTLPCSLFRSGLALLYACWSEDLAKLQDACAQHIEADTSKLERSIITLHAQAMLKVLQGDSNARTWFESESTDYLRYHPDDAELLSFYSSIVITQLARVGKEAQQASHAMLSAEQLRNELPQELTPLFLYRAIHAHNISQLVATTQSGPDQEALLHHAKSFMREHHEQGYLLLAQALREDASSAPTPESRGVMTEPRVP